jgi:wyosine [tRNA(Phe)-imidazoG37] synthetase (radical SAM superfamily)
MNRVAAGVAMERIVEGIARLRTEYRGALKLQMMFMPLNRELVDAFIPIIKRIGPDEVQLNTPRRPFPLEWHLQTRGAHGIDEFDWPTRKLAVIGPDEARRIEEKIRRETGAPVVSIY